MNGLSRTVAVLLLFTMAAALPGVQALALSAPQTSHTAGCHGHGPAQTPAPTSCQCCVNGHHQAIPSASVSLRPLAPLVCRLDAGEDSAVYFLLDKRPAWLIVASASPPSAAPLRI